MQSEATQHIPNDEPELEEPKVKIPEQTALVHEFIRLDLMKDELEGELDKVKAKLTDIGKLIEESILNSGVDPSGSTAMGRVFRFSFQRWPKVLDKKKFIEVMQGDKATAGLVQTSVHYQSLRGFIGSLINNATDRLSDEEKDSFNVQDAIPEKLRGLLEITEKPYLATYPKSKK
jgi:hypothetical protein